MHESSYIKVQSFVENYVDFSSESPIKVLDVGSMIVVPGALTYRSIFKEKKVQYIGLDVAPGLNVDYVPADPYSWSEIPDESIDVVISGQAFEHVPYFWITAAEMSRVLKPRGFLCLVFPSSGAVHRYPFDCWRFYPDSAQALTQFTGLQLIEADTEQSGFRKRVRTDWRETLVIAHKSSAHDEATSSRLRSIVASRPLTEFVDLKLKKGPAITQYENVVKISFVMYGFKSIRRSIFSIWRHRLIPIARVMVKKLIRHDQRKQ
jgi:SAM-dependent methyltransferase